MLDIKWFAGKLLELFIKKEECYYNIFGASTSYLTQVLGHKPTEEELSIAQRGFWELLNRGFIYDISGDYWYKATKSGIDAYSTGAYKSTAGKRLFEYIIDSRILEVSEQSFDSGKYSLAVFGAAKMLEVAVREKAKLGPEIIGYDVVVQAFHPDKGKLILPMCEIEAEKQGALHLFMGAIAFLKNPESHRFTNWIDHEIGVKILQTIEFLLKLVDVAVIKYGVTEEKLDTAPKDDGAGEEYKITKKK